MEISSCICQCVPLHDSYSISCLHYSGIIWPPFFTSMRWESADYWLTCMLALNILLSISRKPDCPKAGHSHQVSIDIYTEAEQGLQQNGFLKSPLYSCQRTCAMHLWYSLPFDVTSRVSWRQVTISTPQLFTSMLCFSVIHAELNKKSSSFCNSSKLPTSSMNCNDV